MCWEGSQHKIWPMDQVVQEYIAVRFCEHLNLQCKLILHSESRLRGRGFQRFHSLPETCLPQADRKNTELTMTATREPSAGSHTCAKHTGLHRHGGISRKSASVLVALGWRTRPWYKLPGQNLLGRCEWKWLNWKRPSSSNFRKGHQDAARINHSINGIISCPCMSRRSNPGRFIDFKVSHRHPHTSQLSTAK